MCEYAGTSLWTILVQIATCNHTRDRSVHFIRHTCIVENECLLVRCFAMLGFEASVFERPRQDVVWICLGEYLVNKCAVDGILIGA